MQDAFLIFVAGAATCGWLAGYWWNKHEAASQCAALERELKQTHALDLRTLTAALADATGELRIAHNRLQAIEEARAAKALPPHVKAAAEICEQWPEGTNPRTVGEYLKGEAA